MDQTVRNLFVFSTSQSAKRLREAPSEQAKQLSLADKIIQVHSAERWKD